MIYEKLKKILWAISLEIMVNSKTRVVNCKKEPYDVYIGRPSKWGNPFKIGRDGSRQEVILNIKI